ncbi:sensor histidine kinase [Chryseolinea lacunae]|uniref:Histidine kinase n=1 Tax=Chryseolinea lacunae TaxID=2801331 RepID=A0ABS1KT10_9BACT|nr:histidine kinase [Chryseolinea lacunae]MBL0742608.1 histidine kinase [Chryseolinea lacunae]
MLRYKSRRQFFKTYGILLLAAWMGFLVRLVKFDAFTLTAQFFMFGLSTVMLATVWELMRYLNFVLDKRYPFERSISGRIVLQLALGAVIGLFVRWLIYLFGESHLPFKLDELFVATTWALYVICTVVINLGFFTDYFLQRWKDSLVVAERLEKEKSQVQFDNLKNQLNPHFLFNALSSLNSLIFENQALASQFVQQLSKVYRYVLQNKDKNFVPLSTELEFIQHYVSLLHTRFSGALAISIDVPEDRETRAVVPVTLQILIENALKHNVVDRDKPLRIEVVTIGDYLVVSNNLQLRNRVDTSNKQGLENLSSLYTFLTDRPLLIEQTSDRFAVKIPLL